MKRDALVQAMEDFGALLELDGANPFKAGAYPKAARTLSDFDGDLDELIEAKRVTELPGIGKGLAEKIEEYYATGRIAELEDLRTRIPMGLLDMTRVPGLGPKKAKLLFEQKGIDSLDKLKSAAEDGSLSALKGFGAKSVEKILTGIEQLARFSGRHRLDTALRRATPILEKLRAHPDVEQAEIAGSLRRRKETIGDIDFVAATKNPSAVMEFFVGLDNVVDTIARGETKTSVMLGSNIQADIRCVAPEEFPYALLHFTGSKEHNTRLRAMAKDRDLKLNEYGLFPDAGGDSLGAKSEADIYSHFGLAFIPPEMREDMGEIELAEKGAIPRLLERADLRGLMHMHTVYSDGKPVLEDYLEWASANGIEWMGVADHSQSLTVARGLTPDRVLQQQKEIDQLNKAWAKENVRLLKGIESDILADGSLDYRDDVLASFDFIVASVHSHFNLTEKEQTARTIRAMENVYTTILGHMTGRLLLAREGFAIDQREVIRKAAEFGVAIEINASPRRLDLDWRLLHFAVELGCKITIGPDAHIIEGLEDLEYGISMARKGWLTKEHVLNCLSAEEFLAFARARQS